jgi:hypothetical protein
MLTLMLIVNYLDRSNVTNARVAGMQADLNMTDVQWSAGISMFYAGYMSTQLPGTLILSKYKPKIVMPLLMLGWSLPTIMFPLVKNAAGFTCARYVVETTTTKRSAEIIGSLSASAKVPFSPGSH